MKVVVEVIEMEPHTITSVCEHEIATVFIHVVLSTTIESSNSST